MQEYSGKLQLTVDDTPGMNYVDITPPEREGYGSQITQLSLLADGDDTGNHGQKIVVGVSTKIPARQTFVPQTEGLPADMLTVDYLYYFTGDPNPLTPIGDLDRAKRTTCCLPSDQLLFNDSVRLCFVVPVAIDAEKGLTIGYRIQLEEVKLTSKIQTELLNRAYS